MTLEELHGALDAYANQLQAEKDALNTELASITVALEELSSSQAATLRENELLKREVAAYKARVEELLARIAELEGEPDPEEPPVPPALKKFVMGFSTKVSWWAAEMTKLVPWTRKITARRLFCDLIVGGNDSEALIKKAIADKQMPCLSFKVPSVTAAMRGDYDEWAKKTGAFMASLGVEVRFVVWHEPNNDMTPAQFVALNLRLGPLMKSAKVKWGTYINGFLFAGTAANKAAGAAFLAKELRDKLDWIGIDAYHDGTMEAPNPTRTPGQRMRAFVAWLDSVGCTLPIGIGEFNALSAVALEDVIKFMLDNAQRFDHACMWSSQTSDAGATDFRLTGARLESFKRGLADIRVAEVAA